MIEKRLIKNDEAVLIISDIECFCWGRGGGGMRCYAQAGAVLSLLSVFLLPSATRVGEILSCDDWNGGVLR